MDQAGLTAAQALACALAVGVAAFYLIEHPARAWLNRVLGANKVAHADPGGGAGNNCGLVTPPIKQP
jgi:peptidoglycan/LPS O-acetylase OafA/YrhL